MARDSLSVLAGARGLERRGGRGGPWPEPNARAAPRDSSCKEEVSEARALGLQSCCFVPTARVGAGAHERGQRLGCRAGRQRRQLSDPGPYRVLRGLPSGQ